MKAASGSAVLVQLIVLYMPSHILFFSHKRGGGGHYFSGLWQSRVTKYHSLTTPPDKL